jgi:hypothetical protein
LKFEKKYEQKCIFGRICLCVDNLQQQFERSMSANNTNDLFYRFSSKTSINILQNSIFCPADVFRLYARILRLRNNEQWAEQLRRLDVANNLNDETTITNEQNKLEEISENATTTVLHVKQFCLVDLLKFMKHLCLHDAEVCVCVFTNNSYYTFQKYTQLIIRLPSSSRLFLSRLSVGWLYMLCVCYKHVNVVQYDEMNCIQIVCSEKRDVCCL